MKYLLVVYIYRRTGTSSSSWQIANEVHKGDLVSWFQESKAWNEQQESKLLWAHPLTKAEFDELEDQLS